MQLSITISTIIILLPLCLKLHKNPTGHRPIPNDTAMFLTANALKMISSYTEKWWNSVYFSILCSIAPYIWLTVSISMNSFERNPWLSCRLTDSMAFPITTVYGTIHAATSICVLSAFKNIFCSVGLNSFYGIFKYYSVEHCTNIYWLLSIQRLWRSLWLDWSWIVLWLVLETGAGYPPAVRVWIWNTILSDSWPVQISDPWCLGGVVARTG